MRLVPALVFEKKYHPNDEPLGCLEIYPPKVAGPYWHYNVLLRETDENKFITEKKHPPRPQEVLHPISESPGASRRGDQRDGGNRNANDTPTEDDKQIHIKTKQIIRLAGGGRR